jgi:deoxyribonuclease-4
MGAGQAAGLKRVTRSLDQVFESTPKTKCKIALEITAGQGTCLGCTFEQLAAILTQSKFPERLAVCLDTAHLFESGFDISSEKGFWNTIKSFDQIVGRERLLAWHLNDSKTPLGSKVDRHEHIGKGRIGLAPFREIMNAPEFAAIPKVLETPKKEDLKEDVVNLGVLKSLIKS